MVARGENICALPALWVGLLYDAGALDAAWDLVRQWSPEDRRLLALNVPKDGLKGQVAGRSVLDVARQITKLSQGRFEKSCYGRQGVLRRN